MSLSYRDRLAELAIVTLDHFYQHKQPVPEPITWLLPAMSEALESARPAHQKWIYAIFAYVARECGVPLPLPRKRAKDDTTGGD